MPPKKKAKKSKKPPPPLEPLEHISQTRERAGNLFKSKKENVNYDIEQNVREIRAILATNAEIFHRCMGSRKKLGDREEFPYVAFTRTGYHNVKVYYDECKGLSKFITCPVRSEKSFDMTALLCPPGGFDGIIAIKQMTEPFSMFMDYGLLFENALLLHEDVLEPVLAELKEQLMSIQVCLGDIETWVMELRTIIGVLEDLFGQTIEIPDINKFWNSCECPKGSHCKSDLCVDCGDRFEAHGEYDPDDPEDCTFMCSGHKVLKELCDSSARYDLAFDVAKENEQKKLKKFLEFLKME